MSDTSSENNSNSEKKISINNNSKPNISYSTDYHVELLHNSTKLIEKDKRRLYESDNNQDSQSKGSNTKSHVSHKSHKSHKSKNSNYQDSEMEEYVTENGHNLSENKFNNNALYGNGNPVMNNTFVPANTMNNLNTFGQNPINNNSGNLPTPPAPQNPFNPMQNNNTMPMDKVNNTLIAQPQQTQSAAATMIEDYDNYNELPPDAQMLKKLDMLRKLGELAQYGVKLSQNYNMNSDYFTMKYEFELHKNIRAKQNSVNWMSSLMLNCIYGVEIMNDKYNPFDLKLTGWSEQINADINNYYDVFGEIYEKYNKPGKNMSPELKLMLMVGGSALKFHLNNTLLANPTRMGIGMQGMGNQMQGMNNQMQGMNNQMQGMNNQMQGMNNQNLPENIDPRILEQMRQQSALDKIRQENAKQNEILKEKMDKEHNLVNQQVQDMVFLQQKKSEQTQQDIKKKKDIEQFEQMKTFFEQQDKLINSNKQQNQHPQNQQYQQNQYPQNQQYQQNQYLQNQQYQQNQPMTKIAPMTQPIGNMGNNNYANLRDSINPPNFNQNVNTQQMYNQNLNANLEMDNARRKQIDEQLNNMKKQVSNLNLSENSDKPRYKSGVNVKKRGGGIDVDTSSNDSSDKSKKSDKTNKSDKSSDESNTDNFDAKNSTSDNFKSKIKVVGDKSLNSKNNASTFSKRKYKRNTISIST